MKTATKGDKPDWFPRPANVVGVNVCRMSGKLPNDGCTSVPAARPDGTLEIKSMIYTDYFVKGQQPTTTCPLHPNAVSLDAALPPHMAVPTTGGTPVTIPSVGGGTVSGGTVSAGGSPGTSGAAVDAKPPDPEEEELLKRILGGGRGEGL
jgi:hypothetical protein